MIRVSRARDRLMGFVGGLAVTVSASSAFAGGGGGGGGVRETSVPFASSASLMALAILAVGYVVYRRGREPVSAPVRIRQSQRR